MSLPTRSLRLLPILRPRPFSTHHHPRPKSLSTFSTIGLTLALGAPAFYLLGHLYPAPSLPLPTPVRLLLGPAYAPAPPSVTSVEGRRRSAALEKQLQGLPIVQEMRKRETEGGWYETRTHTRADPGEHHLTEVVLRGPGKLGVAPLVFAKEDESEAVIVLHLGRSLCGHDGIIHGGMIATMFDEALARNALLNLPTSIGVTASLSLTYLLPTMADQWVLLRTRLVNVNGRKVRVAGEMIGLGGDGMGEAEGGVLAKAEGLFVEPKWAKFLSNSGVKESLGARVVKASE